MGTDKAQRSTEEQLRALLEATSDWVWEMDREARYTYTSPRIRDHLGYEPDEVLGRHALYFVVPEERDRVGAIIGNVLTSPQPASGIEVTCSTKDGRRVMLEIGGAPFFDGAGRLEGFRGIGRNITERKRAEEVLRRSEEKYRSLVSNIPDVVWTVDASLRFVFISPNMERVSGFPLDEIQRRGARLYLDCIHTDDVQKVREAFEGLFARGEPYDVECRVRRANGEWIWVHDRALATYERDGVRYADGLLTDITENKRAEEALRRTEEQYRTLFEGISDAVFVAALGEDSSPGRFLQVNAVACERLGYTREELLRLSARDIDEPEDLTPAISLVRRQRTEKHFLFEVKEITKDGRRIPVEINAQIIEFEGRPAMLAIARDLSDRKRVEEVIRQNEERFRTLVANLPDVTWTSDIHGRTAYISPNVVEVFGYTSEEMRVNGEELWLGRIHPAHRLRVIEAYTALFEENRAFNVEYQIQRRDGKWIWVHDRAFATYERGGVRYADGLFSDITCRKEAEERLRESEERLRSLIESTRDWVWEVDAHGIYTYASPRVKDLLGYEPEEVIGRTPFDFMPPEEAQHVATEFAAMAQGGLTIQRLENTNLHKDGRHVVLETSGAAIFGANGVLRGYCGIDRDITERKRAERELQDAKEVAEAANRAKSEFLASMSHEIRTPMNGILGMTELALDTNLTPEQREYLGMVKASADSLLTVINDILDFSKIEAGKLDFESIDFNPREALDQTMKTLAVRAGQKGLKLNWQVRPEVPESLVGDPGRLRQILVNLVGNAIKFTERGAVTAEVAWESEGPDGVRLRFSVADTGIGIVPERHEAIFQPFAQVDSSTTRRFGGTGLGLSISQKLAEGMGGRIEVESVLGQGSTFRCTLLFGRGKVAREAGAAQPAQLPDLPARHAERSGSCILVAEDNAVNLALTTRLLQKRGYQVEAAGNGREAVEKFKQKCFDAVLMDVQMPEMDGFEATAAIREIEKATGCHVPVIAMTAHAMKGDRERCLAAMDGYVAKPVRAEALFQALERFIPSSFSK